MFQEYIIFQGYNSLIDITYLFHKYGSNPNRDTYKFKTSIADIFIIHI